MPCCTYLSDDQHTSPTTDTELNELLAEVREATGEDWRIAERFVEQRRWFRKPLTVKLYTLYAHTSSIEFQCINFYRPDREDDWLPSIQIMNDAGYVAAYLYGILAGVRADIHIG